MNPIKHIDKATLLIPYEQLYIQSDQQNKQSIPDQYAGDHNTMYQLIYDKHITSSLTKPIDQQTYLKTNRHKFHSNPGAGNWHNTLHTKYLHI
jgi:hypothetical protein